MYHQEARSESEYNDTQAFLSLLKLMLQPDFDRRITPSEALQHAFIGEMPKDVKLGKCGSDRCNCVISVMVVPADDPGEGLSRHTVAKL